MKPGNYTIREESQLIIAFKYAKRLLQQSKKPITIIVSKKKTQRSLNQNSYYWGAVLKVIGDELGYFPEELHHCFATKFLKKFIRMGTDDLETYRSTAKLSTVEFEEYLQQVRIFASTELEILVPLPNEVMDEDYL